jgi:glycosyltransferase involved in cell wall biosynthesis
LNISDEVLWTGFLGRSEKADAFAAATVFVLSSYSENFGIAAAEALAAGVPSVLTRGVALSEYADVNKAALIVDTESKAIAAALRLLLNDQALRQRLSDRGRALCRDRFSSDAVGSALKEFYETVITNAGPRSQGRLLV